MIAIPRNSIRQFRAVLRRAGLHKAAPSQPPAVRVEASATLLILSTCNGDAGVEWRLPGLFTPTRFLLAQDALAFCEGKSEEPVQFVTGDDGQVHVSWTDRSVPQNRSFTTAQDTEPLVVPSPETWETNEPGFLMALHEAMLTTDSESTRYALDSVQLRAGGVMNATNARELFVQTGYRFPWQDDVLIKRSLVCSCRELPQDLPVRIGKSEGWATLQVGTWTLHLSLRTEGRFPDVANVVPPAAGITTRMLIDPRDAAFLAQTLGRLPDSDPNHHPVTVDLNGHVAVRARGAEVPTITELTLQYSRREGPPIRIQINRQYLARALALGFREVAISNADLPVLWDDGKRRYVWGVLEKETALAPSDAAVILTSPETPAPRTPAVKTVPETTSTRLAASRGPVNRIARVATTNHDKAPEPVDLITQAEKVRDALRTALQAVGTLIGAARQQRKQSRLTKSALASLKQLQMLRGD